MNPVFSSAGASSHDDCPPHVMELHLLPDVALLDIWEQTQKAVWAMEEKGWDSASAVQYTRQVLWEMQRRLTQLPVGEHFGTHAPEPALDAAVLPRIVAVRI